MYGIPHTKYSPQPRSVPIGPSSLDTYLKCSSTRGWSARPNLFFFAHLLHTHLLSFTCFLHTAYLPFVVLRKPRASHLSQLRRSNEFPFKNPDLPARVIIEAGSFILTRKEKTNDAFQNRSIRAMLKLLCQKMGR